MKLFSSSIVFPLIDTTEPDEFGLVYVDKKTNIRCCIFKNYKNNFHTLHFVDKYGYTIRKICVRNFITNIVNSIKTTVFLFAGKCEKDNINKLPHATKLLLKKRLVKNEIRANRQNYMENSPK